MVERSLIPRVTPAVRAAQTSVQATRQGPRQVPRRLLLTLALTLLLAGCKAPVFSLVESTPPSVRASTLERPVRLGLIQQPAPALLRFQALVEALRARKHEVSILGREREGDRPLDYVLEAKFRLFGRPWPKTNLLVAWMVGPLFGATGWAGLHYDYEVETELTLARPGAPMPVVQKALLRDTYELAYTSRYYAAMIYGIDGGVVTGFQSAFDELTEPDELEPVEQGFLEHAELKALYLRRVVDSVENAISEDQREGRAERAVEARVITPAAAPHPTASD
ncbi:MAG: hypothetical protein AB7N76_28515 [Planctomycetota bacterium]